MGNPLHTAANAVPPVDYSELADALIDFEGLDWIPGMAKILDGLREADEAARTGQFTADATQTALTTIANPHGPDITHLFALLSQTLTSPANRALANLREDVIKEVQHLGEMHAFEVAESAPRHNLNEAAGLIYENADTAGGGCLAVTDDERKELSKKVAEANKKSTNRPR